MFSSSFGEYVNLDNICDIQKGQQINGEELSEYGNYYVMNGGITPSGYYHICNTKANTISISEGGNSCGYVQYNTLPFWCGGHCYTLQNISSKVIQLYLYHFLKYHEPDIMNLRIGSGLPNIQKKDLANVKVLIPDFETQTRLTNLFTIISSKIANEQSLMLQLSKQRQYLLAEMFI